MDHEAPDGQVVEETVGGAGPRSCPRWGRRRPVMSDSESTATLQSGRMNPLDSGAVTTNAPAAPPRSSTTGAWTPSSANTDDSRDRPGRGRGAERHGVAVPDQLRHLGRQPGRVTGDGAESPHRQRLRARSLRSRWDREHACLAVLQEPREGKMEAGERVVRSVAYAPGQGQRLGQCRLLVEQLDGAITDPAGLDEHHLCTEREEVRQKVFLRMDVGQP